MKKFMILVACVTGLAGIAGAAIAIIHKVRDTVYLRKLLAKDDAYIHGMTGGDKNV